MTRLLDINVLLALAWPNHSLHAPARRWLKSEVIKGSLTIATCPITELGFVRISMNVKGLAQDFNNGVTALSLLINRPEFKHEFWGDEVSLHTIAPRAKPEIGPAQLTDFYLLNLAKARGGRLVTFDGGIKDPYSELIASKS